MKLMRFSWRRIFISFFSTIVLVTRHNVNAHYPFVNESMDYDYKSDSTIHQQGVDDRLSGANAGIIFVGGGVKAVKKY